MGYWLYHLRFMSYCRQLQRHCVLQDATVRCINRRLILLQRRAREACASAIHALQLDLQQLLVQPEELEAFSAFMVTLLYTLALTPKKPMSAPATGLTLAHAAEHDGSCESKV